MVANINLKKTYDRIDWSFLEGVLWRIGFGNMLMDVILICLHSTEMSVPWNGSKLEVFTQERGLRQGEPLSLTSSFCV